MTARALGRAVGGLLRRATVAVVGSAVLLVGVAMIVLPGPATLVIPAGLAILATEFLWARRLLGRVRVRAESLARRAPFVSRGPR